MVKKGQKRTRPYASTGKERGGGMMTSIKRKKGKASKKRISFKESVKKSTARGTKMTKSRSSGSTYFNPNSNPNTITNAGNIDPSPSPALRRGPGGSGHLNESKSAYSKQKKVDPQTLQARLLSGIKTIKK